MLNFTKFVILSIYQMIKHTNQSNLRIDNSLVNNKLIILSSNVYNGYFLVFSYKIGNHILT